MLQNDANPAIIYLKNGSNAAEQTAHREHNDRMISSLAMEDLNYLEMDLEFYEKVSLLFLFYGDTPNANVIVQKLLIGSFAPTARTTYLEEWAHQLKSDQWRHIFIEGLATIKANRIIRKLLLHTQDIHERYMSHIPDANLFIHPILRFLYYVCEQLVQSDATNLIYKISTNWPDARLTGFNNPKYLEIYLLHWISKSVISVGDWTLGERQIHCNVQPILDCWKESDTNYDLKSKLEIAKNRFNYTTNNIIKGKKQKKMNCDDFKAYSDKMDGDMEGLDINSNTKSKLPFDPPLIADDCYAIKRETAGIALIINQHYFTTVPDSPKLSKPLDARTGTEHDQNALQDTLTRFGYKIVVRHNQTDEQIQCEIENVVRQSAGYDSLIVSILSHGFDGHIYGSNTTPVKIRSIIDTMASKELADKPKILIIQACQGDNEQIAAEVPHKPRQFVSTLQHDGPSSSSSVPLLSDYCIAKSTVPGFISYRDTGKGSWFVQTLCEKINEYGARYHLSDIMTKVNGEVSGLRGDRQEMMVPYFETCLRKQFYFPPRL